MPEAVGRRGLAAVLLTVSGIGLLVAAVTVLTALRTAPEISSAAEGVSPLYTAANGWLALVIGLLLIPSFIDSIRLVKGNDHPAVRLPGGWKFASLLLLAAVGAALLVNTVYGLGGWLGSAAAPLFQVLAVIAPIWWS